MDKTLNLVPFVADPIPAGPAPLVQQAMPRLRSPMNPRLLQSASICAICGQSPSRRRPATGAFDRAPYRKVSSMVVGWVEQRSGVRPTAIARRISVGLAPLDGPYATASPRPPSHSAIPVPAGPVRLVRGAMPRPRSPNDPRYLQSASICAICGQSPSWRPAIGAFDRTLQASGTAGIEAETPLDGPARRWLPAIHPTISSADQPISPLARLPHPGRPRPIQQDFAPFRPPGPFPDLHPRIASGMNPLPFPETSQEIREMAKKGE